MMKPILTVAISGFFLLAEMLHAQMLDTTFDAIGYTHTDGLGGSINNLVIQPDGKIVSAYDLYWLQPSQYEELKIARTNPDGLLDTTFGTQGTASVWLGETASAQDVALQPDGKIILTGRADYCVQIICGLPNLGVVRFLPDGIVDSSFGTNGLVRSEDIFGPTYIAGACASRVIVLANGQMLIGGYCWTNYPAAISKYMYVARLNSDGSLDNTFANGGIYMNTPYNHYYEFGDMQIDNSGNIYFTGRKYNPTTQLYEAFVSKLTPGGFIDNSFGTSGLSATPYIGQFPCPQRLAIRNDGKIIIAGYLQDSVSTGHTGFIAMFEANGTVSNEIAGGTRYFTYAGWDQTDIWELKVLGDHRILFCGIMYTNTNYHTIAMVGRLNPDGTDDVTFTGSAGYATYQIGPFSTFQAGTFFNCLGQQPDGKIVLGGSRNTQTQNSYQAFTIVRITPDSIMTTIQEPAVVGEFSLYPSINNGTFRVELNENLTANVYTLEIIDVMGKTVHTESLSGSTIYNVQFDGAPGMYYARVRGREYSGVKSFVRL